MHTRSIAIACLAIIAAVLFVVLSFRGGQSVYVATPTLTATSTPVAPVSTGASTSPVILPVPSPSVPKKAPIVPTTPQPTPPTLPAPPVATQPPPTAIGTTTLALRSIPLLSGGVVHAGEWVPISYLQITNVGQAGARLTGFSISQQGSAPDEALIGVSTVDDKGGSKSSVGGNQAAKPFEHGTAFVPTDVYFAPGQERLFTIKVMLSHQVSPYLGTQLVLVVSSIESTASPQGQFPIQGTTWTIAP